MPPVTVDRRSVLMGRVELEDDLNLKYRDLDALIDQHSIDVTGLTWTRTKNGSVFRAYLLMTH